MLRESFVELASGYAGLFDGFDVLCDYDDI
jgi:hypothetical protein